MDGIRRNYERPGYPDTRANPPSISYAYVNPARCPTCGGPARVASSHVMYRWVRCCECGRAKQAGIPVSRKPQ